MKAFFLFRTVLISYFLIIAALSSGQENKSSSFDKKDLRLDLKLPHINYMWVSPAGKFTDDKIGFNGYGIGLEYSYSDKKFLETSVSIVSTFEFPIPLHIDKEYNKLISSYYFSLTDNFVLNRFTAGYGVNYSSNNWKEWMRDMDRIGLPTTGYKFYSNKSFGITLKSYYQIDRSFNLGLIYRPTLLMVNHGAEFNLEHLISLELNFRIKISNSAD